MRRGALVAALAGLSLAAPAQAALAPPPTVLDFEALPVGPLDAASMPARASTLAAPPATGFCFGRAAAVAAAPLDCAAWSQPGHDSERSLDVFGGNAR